MANKIKLDRPGIRAVLKDQPEVIAEIRDLAERVAGTVRANAAVVRHSMEVGVNHTTTDRAKAYITLLHAGGMATQAKHGVFSRAAAANGMQMTDR